MFGRITLDSVYSTVCRKIDIKVTENLCNVLGLPNDLYKVFTEEDKQYRKTGGANGTSLDNNTKNEYLYIEATETPEEDCATVLYNETIFKTPLYKDDEIRTGLYLRKQHVSRNIVITYFSKSKSKLMGIVDRIRSNEIFSRTNIQHDLEYYIKIPNNAISYIHHFYTLKMKRLEKNERIDFTKYLKSTTVAGFDTSNLGKNNEYKDELLYKEIALNCIGYVTNSLYQIEFDKDMKYYKTSFEYTIHYRRPLYLILEYPLQIWNTPVDSLLTRCHFRKTNYGSVLPNLFNHRWQGLYDLNIQPYKDQIYHETLCNFKYPTIDRNVNAEFPRHYTTLLTILLTVDNNQYNVCNLFSLPTFKFKKVFQDYILENKQEIFIHSKAIFYIELLVNDNIGYRYTLSINDSGDITSDFPLDFKNEYRLRISLICDMNNLHSESFDKMVTWIDKNKPNTETINENNDEQKLNWKKLAKHNDENKYYTVDEYGNILDYDGYVVFNDGTYPVNEDGKKILGGKKLGVFNGDIKTGYYIDKNNNIVNSDGYIVDENGNLIRDEIGNLIDGDIPSYHKIDEYTRILFLPQQKENVETNKVNFLSDFLSIYSVELPDLSEWIDIPTNDILRSASEYMIKSKVDRIQPLFCFEKIDRRIK